MVAGAVMCPLVSASFRRTTMISESAVEHAPTPQEFAQHYAAFSHWMITSATAASGTRRVRA